MTSERLERISSKAPGATPTPATKPTEPEQLPCPRCDSTNTKFCYYNNYNLSQPRHFCKSCRRYWTRGGTLRNVPIGGGTRRSSSASKRPRTNSSSSSSTITTVVGHQDVLNSVPVDSGNFGGHFCDMNLNEALPERGGFSSLLNGDMNGVGGLFYGVPGRYVGAGSGFYGMGLGWNMFDFPMEAVRESGNTWQLSGVEGGGLNVGNNDNFGWPDLAISTQGKSLE